MKALVVESPNHCLPAGSSQTLSDAGCEIDVSHNYADAIEATGNTTFDAILLAAPSPNITPSTSHADYGRLLALIDAQQIAAIVVSGAPASTTDLAFEDGSLIDVVEPGVSLTELQGRFAMIKRYHEKFRSLEKELAQIKKIGGQLDEHFRELNQEMRLAARLQQDFLPKIKDPIDGLGFASIYRPASWVSGDIFDIFRVDENHTAFYIADAVGHGMAASLLTIFIKRAIISKHIEDGDYKIFTPSETLANLNRALLDQALPNCQFVTAWYGLFDHRTLTLQYAGGGHPYPMLITENRHVASLEAVGGLLGVFEDEDFPTVETQLHPGDKLLMYTDGIELVFQEQEPIDTLAFHGVFESLAALPVDTMLKRIEKRLNDESGSLNPRDDLTIVGLEVL